MSEKETLSEAISQSARGSLTLIIGQGISTFIMAVGSIVVARFLGSTSFGLLTVAQIPISMALLVINGNVSRGVMKYVAQYNFEKKVDQVDSVAFSGLFVNLLIAFFLTQVILLYSRFLSVEVFSLPEIEVLIKVLSFQLIAQAMFDVFDATYIGLNRNDFSSVLSIIKSLFKSFLPPLLVFLGYGVFGAALGEVLTIGLSSLFAYFIFLYLRKRGFPEIYSDLLRHAKLLLVYSYPLLLSSILGGGLVQVFKFILPIYADAQDIGNFAAAQNFTILITFLTIPITKSLFPLFSKIERDQKDSLKEIFQNSVKYMAFLVFPITTFLISFSSQIVLVLYGPDYQTAPFYLEIFMFNFFFIGLGAMTVGSFLGGQGHTRVTLNMTLLYTALGLPLGFFLISRYGVTGFILSQIIFPKIGLLYGLFWIYQKYEFTVKLDEFAKLASLSLIPYIILKYLFKLIDLNPWVEILFGGLSIMFIFYSSLPVLRLIDRNDVRYLEDNVRLFGPFSFVFNYYIRYLNRVL